MMDGNGCWLGLPSTAWLEAWQGVEDVFGVGQASSLPVRAASLPPANALHGKHGAEMPL